MVEVMESATLSGSPRAKFGHLPALPEVTFKILSMAKDPDSTTEDLQRLICSDIALSTRILKVVNSAFYGLSRQVSTIDRAVMILGRNAVRNIAVAASMVKIFTTGPRTDQFDARRLWMHSTATATAARILSSHLHLGDANEVFLAGLMHDIGIMAEMHWAPEKLMHCLLELSSNADDAPSSDLRTAETHWFGMDHQDLGKEVCEHWNFPSLTADIIGVHHNPLVLVSGNHRELACLVSVADHLAAGLPKGFRLDLPELEISDAVLEEIHLRRDDLNAITERLVCEMDEVARLLS